MKKCPFCKAEIEDNASFCLYCMSQLGEKKVIAVTENNKKTKIPILICVTVCLCVVGVFGFYLISKKNKPPVGDSNSNAISFSQKELNVESDVESSEGVSDDVSEGGEESNSQKPEGNQQIVYKYRNSIFGDEVQGYGVSAEYIENGVTIIGVETVAEDGVYVIPETIDGKKVISIESNAFCEDHIKDTVKVVYVPKTVVGIQNYAFSKCYNMTDLYIQGESVAGGPDLFFPSLGKANNTIILHASETCNDRNFTTFSGRYHYDAVISGYELVWKFEKWDGLQ